MERNERCWCDSGRKWKNCHRLREELAPLPTSAFNSKFFEVANSLGTCLHPEAPTNCSNGVIRAHTVQRSTALKSISENGHVLSGRNTPARSYDKETLYPIGITIASTFRGFCSYHDTTTFRKSDVARNVGQEEAFLLSYRALCYELYMKMVAVPVVEFLRDRMDAGRPFDEQARMQTFLHANMHTTKLGLFEHKRIKEQWDKGLHCFGGDNFLWSYIEFDRPFPLVCSGAFFPERDFKGLPLQQLDAPIGHLSLMGFNVIPVNGRCHWILGWLDKKQQSDRFAKALYELSSVDFTNALIQFCFDTSDNIFVRPSWWESLSPFTRRFLTWTLRSSTPGQKKSNGLVPLKTDMFEASVVSIRRHDNR